MASISALTASRTDGLTDLIATYAPDAAPPIVLRLASYSSARAADDVGSRFTDLAGDALRLRGKLDDDAMRQLVERAEVAVNHDYAVLAVDRAMRALVFW